VAKLTEYKWRLGIKYSPDQPRVPAGDPSGGQWTSGGASWKPTMTSEEASKWNAGTALAGREFYHYASQSKVGSAKANGIPLANGARGKGVYLTTSDDPRTANFAMAPDRKLTVRVRVENPFRGRFRDVMKLEEKIDPEGKRNLETMDILTESGYDGYIIPRSDGSEWLIVPDKKQIVIVDDRKFWD